MKVRELLDKASDEIPEIFLRRQGERFIHPNFGVSMALVQIQPGRLIHFWIEVTGKIRGDDSQIICIPFLHPGCNNSGVTSVVALFMEETH